MTEITLVQMAPILGDVEANLANIRKKIKSSESQLFILPELANSGYRFKNFDEAWAVSETLNESIFIDELIRIAKDKQAYIVSGFCEKAGDKLYNSAILIGSQGVEGHYRKLHLFMDEKEIFTPGDLGLPVFNTPFGKIGMLVCFDWMFPEAWRSLALQGAQLIAHPSNLVLPYCQSVVPSYALVNRCYIATCNRVGSERDLNFTGQSIVADPKENILVRGDSEKEEIIKVEVDLTLSLDKSITARNDAFADRRSDVYGNLNLEK